MVGRGGAWRDGADFGWFELEPPMSAVARDGLPDILVNQPAQEVLADAYEWTAPHTVAVKGRSGAVVVFGTPP